MGVTDPKYLSIEEMPAGRDMDVKVAEAVFGWKVVVEKSHTGFFNKQGLFQAVPRYSTEMAAAWEVVEHLRKQGCDFDFFASSTRVNPDHWADAVFLTQTTEFLTRAKTAELAICRSALKTVQGG